MSGVDPTTVRLSDNFLLSDFMGCDSVYRHGYANPFTTADEPKLKQGRALAKSLDRIYLTYGPISIAYGYISPRLSRKIVKYQNPDKPSFHRWDLGAAADIKVHNWFENPFSYESPIAWVADFCRLDDFPFDRIITYSESPIICVAFSDMDREPWNRVYENRFLPGKQKPGFFKYPTNNDEVRLKRLHAAAELVSETWKGQGHPRHHGGGRFQYEHARLNEYTILSDFLYSPVRVHKGQPNPAPKSRTPNVVWLDAAAIYNKHIQGIAFVQSARPSIVSAIDCNKQPWEDRFVLDYVPSPAMFDAKARFEDAADRAFSEGVRIAAVREIKMKRGEKRIRVIGSAT